MNEDFDDIDQHYSVVKMYNEMLITALHSNDDLLLMDNEYVSKIAELFDSLFLP